MRSRSFHCFRHLPPRIVSSHSHASLLQARVDNGTALPSPADAQAAPLARAAPAAEQAPKPVALATQPSAPPAPIDAPPEAGGPKRSTKVRFWLQFHAEYGQRVVVVGSSEALGR